MKTLLSWALAILMVTMWWGFRDNSTPAHPATVNGAPGLAATPTAQRVQLVKRESPHPTPAEDRQAAEKILDRAYIADAIGAISQFQHGVDKFTRSGIAGQSGDMSTAESLMDSAVPDFEEAKQTLDGVDPPRHFRRIHRQLKNAFGLAIKGSKLSADGISSSDAARIRRGGDEFGESTPIIEQVSAEVMELRQRDGLG